MVAKRNVTTITCPYGSYCTDTRGFARVGTTRTPRKDDTMDTDQFNSICTRIREARDSGETDTPLGRALARWENHEITIQRDGKWLLEGFITTFKRDLEILNAIDPAISPDLPRHLLDPAQISRFFSIPLEEFNYTGQQNYAEVAMTIQRMESKLDRSLAEYVSLKSAADITGLSYSHVRRAVLGGELPASNVSTASHPAYRIARTDLTAWMQTKKGGPSPIPPRSDLDELIERHLPGLRSRKDSATR